MIRRLIAVICYVVAVLSTIGWMLNAETESTFNYSNKKSYISVLLIVVLWAAPFILFKESGDKDEK